VTDETAGLSLAPASRISLVLSSPPSNIRASAHPHTRTYAYRDAAGAFSLSLLRTHAHVRRVHHTPCRTLGSSSSSSSSSLDGSSFLQTVRLKRFDTVFDGCFNRSFEQSLWTRTLLLSLSLSLSLSLCLSSSSFFLLFVYPSLFFFPY